MTIKTLIIVSAVAVLAGCTSHTSYGDCVGAFDEKDPKLTYHLSAWNLFLGILFFELIVPPVIIVADETSCPTGSK